MSSPRTNKDTGQLCSVVLILCNLSIFLDSQGRKTYWALKQSDVSSFQNELCIGIKIKLNIKGVWVYIYNIYKLSCMK